MSGRVEWGREEERTKELSQEVRDEGQWTLARCEQGRVSSAVGKEKGTRNKTQEKGTHAHDHETMQTPVKRWQKAIPRRKEKSKTKQKRKAEYATILRGHFGFALPCLVLRCSFVFVLVRTLPFPLALSFVVKPY